MLFVELSALSAQASRLIWEGNHGNSVFFAVVSGKTRSAVLPDVLTFDEQGVAGYEAGNWIGIAAPAGTPPAVIARLNKEISAIQDSADFKSKLDADGAVVVKFTPTEFSAFMERELEKWGRVVKEAKIKAE